MNGEKSTQRKVAEHPATVGTTAAAVGGVLVWLIQSGMLPIGGGSQAPHPELMQRMTALESELNHKADGERLTRVEVLIEQQAIHINNLAIENKTTSDQFNELISVLKERQP